ncbi:phage tail tape measure protein [Rhizobium sp. CFBP 8762]|uniref:phage tail tape measure protein n=1 Tax=Rhizobium sp. CFBP 8762 TaxID=2775279 RepID=UPI00177EA119|nr:phage tail tape measure protein [Rhizobium sp. CFBP 8762]MBD8556348.1 phage tail tape measure protein [Rhizobium sp. CFBP 8762]
MTDLDVALRLRLVNQLSKPAEEAERDLKDLAKAAHQLGVVRGGDSLAADMRKLGIQAGDAKGKLQGVSKEADDLRQAIGMVNKEGFDGLKTDAEQARLAIGSVSSETREVKASLSALDSGNLRTIHADAAKAEAAIRGIGGAATDAHQRLGRVQVPSAAYRKAERVLGTTVPGQTGGGFMAAADGAFDQFGVPIALGAGAAYAAGAVPAAALAISGAAIHSSAIDERRSDFLRNMGSYGAEEQAAILKRMRDVGAKRGIGTQGAMDAFAGLLAGGMDYTDALAIFDDAIVFSTAADATPAAAADTTVALADNMGISPKDMPKAYDAMALGGKDGKFEPKHMAANYPSMLAQMGSIGDGGLRGVRFTTAAAQAIRRQTGTASETATRFENMIKYLSSTEGLTNFKEAGIDPSAIMKAAVAKGDSPILAILDLMKRKVGTTPEDVGKVVGEDDAKAGFVAVLNSLPKIVEAMEKMENADGTVAKDYQAAIDNVLSSTDRLSANIGAGVKNIADPVLPFLNKVIGGLANMMEANRASNDWQEETRELAAKLASEGKTNAEIRDRLIKRETEAGGAPQDGFGWLMSDTADGNPSTMRRILFGDAADKNFDVQKHFAIQLGLPRTPNAHAAITGTASGNLGKSSGPDFVPTPLSRPGPMPLGKPLSLMTFEADKVAQDNMAAYVNGLQQGGDKAEAEADSIADRIKAVLGFTVSPTISPTFVPPTFLPPAPAGAPAGPGSGIGRQSSLGTTSNTKVTQYISSPNSRLAAMKAKRELNREVRLAQARSYGDVGGRLA